MRWDYSLSFILLAYSFSVLFSIVAIISEELTYNQYKKKKIGIKLIIISFLEPIVNHPFILYAAIKGNIEYYFYKKIEWGTITRKGMGNT